SSFSVIDQEKIKDFLDKHPISWELKGGVDFIGLEDNTFNIKCMPTNMIIDKNRNIKYFKCGTVGFGSEYTKILAHASQSKE
ncbi:MAG: hypothetical protein AAGG68_26555, partial [Bacteroidota bacterium]